MGLRILRKRSQIYSRANRFTGDRRSQRERQDKAAEPFADGILFNNPGGGENRRPGLMSRQKCRASPHR